MSIVELTLSRKPATPQETFLNLAEHCAPLEITKQDVYGDFSIPTYASWLQRFESELGEAVGKEGALFLPSGGMAQQIALLIHQKSAAVSGSRTFVCHYTSHLLLHEQDAHSELLHMDALVVAPEEGAVVQPPLTFANTKPLLMVDPPPFALIVECPHREIGGKCTPFEDLQQLSALCRARGVRMHMDGARLWEATAAYGRSLPEICALFDSIYVSFYKGLGGLSGAMLMGTQDFITQSRVWLRRFGGNLFTLMPYAVSAWVGYRENVNDFDRRLRRLQHVVALVTSEVCDKYPNLIRFDPPVPEVSLVHVYINACCDAVVDGVSMALRIKDEAARECSVSCFSRMRPARSGGGEVYSEFNMGPLNMEIDDRSWVLGWETFAKKMQQALR